MGHIFMKENCIQYIHIGMFIVIFHISLIFLIKNNKNFILCQGGEFEKKK